MNSHLVPLDCIGQTCPRVVWEPCFKCGTRFKTSARAMAEGRDLCKKCRPPAQELPPEVNLRSIHMEHFKALYTFFELFWDWINNRGIEKEAFLAHAVNDVHKSALLEVHRASDEISMEEQEIRILLTLFEAYLNWRDIRECPRLWKHLFYAFWMCDNFYRGDSQ